MFIKACSTITQTSLRYMHFPTDNHHANWFAKHLFLVSSGEIRAVEASVDDMMCVVFDALGFNDNNLLTVYVSHLVCSISLTYCRLVLATNSRSQCQIKLCTPMLI